VPPVQIGEELVQRLAYRHPWTSLTQAEAGAILGIRQPHVSGLMRGQSGNFSVERLMDFLTALGQDVEITVRPASKAHGGVSLALG
jgi:predicted XRE-type DNA-binding protein